MHSETPQLAISGFEWLEAFEKLDATLLHLQAATAGVEA
jgi:hypothetical protein